MKKLIALLVFATSLGLSSSAQSLEFLGLTDVRFGMKLEELSNRQLIIDSTTSYPDTATYLKNTRCQMYFRHAEKLTLKGFNASRIEYEFCSGELGYVFVYVNGKAEIEKAIAQLKLSFPRMGCGKKTDPVTCSLIDTHNAKLRMIVRINQATNEMNFVLIPRKKAK